MIKKLKKLLGICEHNWALIKTSNANIVWEHFNIKCKKKYNIDIKAKYHI